MTKGLAMDPERKRRIEAAKIANNTCPSCHGPAHPCVHGPFERCEHCVPGYWVRVQYLALRLDALERMEVSTVPLVEAWMRLMFSLITEANELGVTFEELVER